MIDNAIDEGFILTAKNVAFWEEPEPPTVISPGRLGELVEEFLRGRLKNQPHIQIALSLESRDILHEVFETQYLVKDEKSSTTNQDFTRNYWVEVPQLT
jgi:hypothetical protein